MTIIRATCDNCGDVQLHEYDLTVQIEKNTEQGAYVFRCPEDGLINRRDTSRRIVDLLMTNGVHMELIDLSMSEDDIASGIAIEASLGKLTSDERIDWGLANNTDLLEAYREEIVAEYGGIDQDGL